jgi:hypothetical protein
MECIRQAFVPNGRIAFGRFEVTKNKFGMVSPNADVVWKGRLRVIIEISVAK